MRVASAFLLVALTSFAAADPVVDQEQPSFHASRATLAVGGTSEQRLAQTVTAGREGPLVAVQLPAGCESGTLIVEILSVDGDRPGTSVLAHEEVAAGSLPRVAEDFISIAVDPPVRMRSGQRFTIALRNESGSCGIIRAPDGDSYTRGDAFFDARPNPRGWIPSRDIYPYYDLAFKTVVDTSRGEPPCRTEFGDLPFGRSVPVCRCLQDIGLRTQRCALLHPDFFLFRRIPWPLKPGQKFKVEWTLVPLTSLVGNFEIREALPDGFTARKPSVVFRQVKPGASLTHSYDAVAGPKSGEIATTFSIGGSMHSAVEVGAPPP